MNSTQRLFIAITIPEPILNKIAQMMTMLRPVSGQALTWVKPNNIHITLKFLGETSTQLVPTLNSALSKIAQASSPVPLSIHGIGYFPSALRAKVLWVGLRGSDRLSVLQKKIERDLELQGFESDPKPFSPHLTIARVRDSADNLQLKAIIVNMASFESAQFGDFSVNHFELFRSVLTPQGPIYSVVSHFNLNSSAENMLESTQK